MCEPKYFDVYYVINPWMAGNEGKVDRKLAEKQWQNLHDILSRKATIKLIEPVTGLPDMVFTANGGLVYRNHKAITSSFRHLERQAESGYFRKYFEDSGYLVSELGSGIHFEGAGDALYDSSGQIWMGYGHRSDIEAAHEIASIFQTRVIRLTLVDSKWYHLDTAFCPLERGYVIAYKKAFSAESAGNIQNAFGGKAIWVSDEDAHDFACNAVNIGSDVIMHRASDKLKTALEEAGFNIIEANVSEFIKAGGACKCLTLEL
ncbi:MAG: arginine deiminase-related protein, partial [Gallionellaceae bacterium]|nr:arginine deiminase-related protein [Gallionellaceae bacterium]